MVRTNVPIVSTPSFGNRLHTAYDRGYEDFQEFLYYELSVNRHLIPDPYTAS